MRGVWIGTVGALALVATGLTGGAGATTVLAPPAPCFGVAQITDPNGDGHHDGTDVLSAWFSMEAGPLQGVIKVKSGLWVPQHEDEDGSAYVLLFSVGGQTWYVRASAAPGGALAYDYGTYAGGRTFTSLGPTTGTVVYATGGTVTMDIPSATGATTGTVLANPYVLTYDGIDWVDHAPGGTLPTDSARGADYTVGPCDTGGGATVAVQLTAPSKIVGGGKNATITGKAFPGKPGVDVALTRTNVTTKVFHATTAADGSFRFVVPVHETTRVRATAEGISSQTLAITVKSTVRISVKRIGRAARISGRISPALPGRVLILRTTAFRPTKTITRFRAGKFSVLLARPTKGRYQAVYIPKGNRAERSTSNTIRIR